VLSNRSDQEQQLLMMVSASPAAWSLQTHGTWMLSVLEHPYGQAAVLARSCLQALGCRNQKVLEEAAKFQGWLMTRKQCAFV